MLWYIDQVARTCVLVLWYIYIYIYIYIVLQTLRRSNGTYLCSCVMIYIYIYCFADTSKIKWHVLVFLCYDIYIYILFCRHFKDRVAGICVLVLWYIYTLFCRNFEDRMARTCVLVLCSINIELFQWRSLYVSFSIKLASNVLVIHLLQEKWNNTLKAFYVYRIKWHKTHVNH